MIYFLFTPYFVQIHKMQDTIYPIDSMIDNEDDNFSEYGDETSPPHNDEFMNPLHDFSTCFYCNSRLHTIRCPDYDSQTYPLRARIVHKIEYGSITKENFQNIFDHIDIIDAQDLVSNFGYFHDTTLEQVKKICIVIYGIYFNWFSSSDLVNVSVEYQLYNDRNNDDNIRCTQIERNREWNSLVHNTHIIRLPCMGKLKKSYFQLYKKFAIKCRLRKLFHVMYFPNDFISPSPSIIRYIELRWRYITAHYYIPNNVTFDNYIVGGPSGITTNTVYGPSGITINTVENTGMTGVNGHSPSSRSLFIGNGYGITGPPRFVGSIYGDDTMPMPNTAQYAGATGSTLNSFTQNDKMKQIWKSVAILKNQFELGDDDSEICPVCVEVIPENKNIITNCHHNICSDCIVKVFEKCGKRCVICRTDISTLQFETKDQIIHFQDVKIQALM